MSYHPGLKSSINLQNILQPEKISFGYKCIPASLIQGQKRSSCSIVALENYSVFFFFFPLQNSQCQLLNLSCQENPLIWEQRTGLRPLLYVYHLGNGVLCCAVLSHSVVSDSLQPHGLQPTKLPCPWGLSRQEHWSALPCPPPGDFPNPEIEPRSPSLKADSLPAEPPGKPQRCPNKIRLDLCLKKRKTC